MKKFLLAAAVVLAFASPASAQYSTTAGYGGGFPDGAGALLTDTEGRIPTYSYTVNDYTPTTSATAMLSICGSSTKTVRVRRVLVGGDATANAIYDVYLFKRTTLNTGGTATSPTATLHDSKNPTASATLYLYTANPSGLGTGTMFRGGHLLLPNATTPTTTPLWWDWQFGTVNEQSLVLRGAAECLEISNNGNTVPGGTSIYLTISWTEE